MKKLIALLMTLALVFSACCAQAETAADSFEGTWYMTKVTIDGTEYDLSLSAAKPVLELRAGGEGIFRTAPDSEEETVTWAADSAGGIRVSLSADREFVSPDAVPGGDSLTLSGESTVYVLSREAGEDAGIRSGIRAEYTCEVPEGSEKTLEELRTPAMEIIRSRLESREIGNADIQPAGANGIRVLLPYVYDPEIPGLIGKPGEIRFLDPDGNVIMTGDRVKTAEYAYREGMHLVEFTLTDEGRELFADATAKSIGKNIRITLDDEVLVDATVQSAITDGNVLLSGSYTQEAAKNIAAQFRSGALPLKLAQDRLDIVYDLDGAVQAAAVIRAEKADAATVILKLGDREVTKAEVEEATRYQLDSMAYLYAMYGMAYDTTDPANIAQARADAIEDLKQDMVLTAKAKELGLDRLTEAEEAEVRAKAEESWNGAVEYVEQYLLGNDEKQGKSTDAIRTLAEERLHEMGYSLDSYLESQTKIMVDEKLHREIVKDVAVTDEEVQAEYESRVAADREKYEASPDACTSALNNGTFLYYTPAGIRRVKQILTLFQSEDQTAITAAKSELTQAVRAENAARTKAEEAKAVLEKEDAEETAKEQVRADLEAAEKELEEAEAKTAEARQAVEDATDKAFANIDERADAVLAALDAGEAWEKLMAEKNQDPGMQNNPKGYAVCAEMTSFDKAFVDGAMALEKPGDHSGKIRGSAYGYYIIRYESDEPEGPVSPESVKDSIAETMLTNRQNETYNTTVAEWIQNAGIEENLAALD